MDELMMDWLYEELDPSSSARVTEHVDGCARCSAEIGALRRTRAAFRGLSDVEPPPAVSAILLHEAARRTHGTAATAAPRADAASRRFWLRLRAWLQPIALHPAATAMATLILVAGVAGALYVRRGWDIGSPMQVPAAHEGADESRSVAATPVPEPPPPPGAPADRAKLATGAGSEVADGRADRNDAYAAGLVEGDAEAELRAAGSANQSAKRIARRKRAVAEKQQEVAAADDLQPGKGAKDKDGIRQRGLDPARPESAAAPAESTDAAVGGASADTGRLSRAKKAAPPADAKARLENGESAPSREEQGWLEVQEQKLAALARGKRCREAAAIANDILDRNPAYYSRRVRDSRQLQPCRTYVASEQRRRAAVRAKSPPAAASKAASEPAQKVQAAPARDEAADKSAN
jgi:hypothetical protein